ncbi:DUF3667 domain-containing protein [Aquimarina sp. RZ0]|uniref:DUF3667 domain-containing protein n=1 Tax=Aquimarina sp. RZ0 TaxID=2607730 RepID=UPI0011F1ED48|nr:DUF3667 domain-containing protein [Aquimarina sp. RZ0]KAA1245550.1 DUF3667 domain-containing protein [Aquimarina sp. RZ0]
MKEKGRFLKKYRGNKCLNCATPLDILDKYCHNCGQINTTKKISLNDFFGEFLSSLFSYDSRLAHTINALLFSPGKISKEYIEGKRIKYANPFRFYLSVSIIFFIINGLFIDFDSFTSGVKDGVETTREKGVKTIDSIKQNFDGELKINLDSLPEHIGEGFPIKIDSLPQNLKKEFSIETDSSGNATINLSSLIKKEKQKKEVIYYTQEQLDTISIISKGFKLWPMYEDYHDRTKETSTYRALAALEHRPNWFNKYIYHRVLKTADLENNYGKELLEFLFNKLPFIIFFFLPFFALSIWLLYLRRPFNYMEHLVFTFHTQTMFFILIGTGILINMITKSETPSAIAVWVFLFYLYKAMRKFYGQSRIKTIFKFFLVNTSFFFLAAVGSLITILGSIFIF